MDGAPKVQQTPYVFIPLHMSINRARLQLLHLGGRRPTLPYG
jgi:hypothetical protein